MNDSTNPRRPGQPSESIEVVSHVLATREKTDGTPIDLAAEQRRVDALRHVATELAQQLDVLLDGECHSRPDLPPTARAAVIKNLAQPQMSQAADGILIKSINFEVTTPQGVKVSFVGRVIRCRARSSDAIKALSTLIAPFKIKVSIRTGRWRTKASVGNDEGSGAREGGSVTDEGH